MTSLAGVTHQTKWFYFTTPSGTWYIARCASPSVTPGIVVDCAVLLLEGIDVQANDVVWRPIHGFPATGRFPGAGTVFSSVSISRDGKVVQFGGLAQKSTDSSVAQLEHNQFAVRWLYLSTEQDRKLYIVDATDAASKTPAVLMLKAVDSGFAGGIAWKPIQNFQAFGGFPAAGLRFDSVSLAGDARSVTFSSLK